MNIPGPARHAIASVALGVSLLGLLSSAASAAPHEGGTPSAIYVVPHVNPGDRIATMFSKTTAVTISGFDPRVSCVSGIATIVIRSIAATDRTYTIFVHVESSAETKSV